MQIVFYPTHFKKHKAIAPTLPAPYLNGQDRGVLRNIPYGLRDVGNVGCGPLALYNAMVYLGKKPDLPRILRYMELTSTFPFAL